MRLICRKSEMKPQKNYENKQYAKYFKTFDYINNPNAIIRILAYVQLIRIYMPYIFQPLWKFFLQFSTFFQVKQYHSCPVIWIHVEKKQECSSPLSFAFTHVPEKKLFISLLARIILQLVFLLHVTISRLVSQVGYRNRLNQLMAFYTY